jgi:hypothetical protein
MLNKNLFSLRFYGKANNQNFSSINNLYILLCKMLWSSMLNNWLWGSGGEVKSLWSIYVGLHMRYKGRNKEKLRLTLTQNSKNYQSSDCRLKLVYMKSESLVIVNHHVTVNDLSNFAHTAHHARRVVSAGHLSSRYRGYLYAPHREDKDFYLGFYFPDWSFYLPIVKEYSLIT